MKIALLGLGTIGRGVYDIIHNQPLPLEVKKIYDRIHLSEFEGLYANSLDEIYHDSEIEAIVEVMGGEEFPYQVIKEALHHHKSIVTANKEVISRHVEELTLLKSKMGVELCYEASVGGGIPIIRPLFHIKKTNEISKIEAILNGTTNYILTRMEEGESFDGALKEAQKLGFAEADPTQDLLGLDALRKIAILGMIATNQRIDYNMIPHGGIQAINQSDITFLKKNGYTLKMIATLKDQYASVEPVAIQKDHLFSQVKYETNAIILSTNYYHDLTFIGKGAGRYPTASAIVDDLLTLEGHRDAYSINLQKSMGIKDTEESYYCRISDIETFPSSLVLLREGNQFITKPILRKKLNHEHIEFYARIRKED
ncbi:MAG: homoserine dehydrogenase [Bacilli bacterium]|nr:homoserine dehydrogenase [Bacilli bacterium]